MRLPYALLKELPFLLPALRIGNIEVEKKISDQVFDLVFKIKTQNRQEWLLLCEIKELLQPRMTREISARFKERIANLDGVYPVLITTFIGERTREILAELFLMLLKKIFQYSGWDLTQHFEAFYELRHDAEDPPGLRRG